MKYRLLKESALRELMEEDGWRREHTLIDPSLPGGGQGTYEFEPNGDLVDYEPDERDPEFFCSDCYDENCDTKTLRQWAEEFQEDGLLPSDIDLDQFDNTDRICLDCAKKSLKTYY